MPFTPFHMGPAIAMGLLMRGFVHVPTLVLASVVLDLEPLAVLVFGLNYPLHGFMHTLIFAVPIGAIFGWAMLRVEKRVKPIYRRLLLESNSEVTATGFIGAGALGTFSHVVLDSPLYADIMPFFPLTVNPAYNPELSPLIYSICVWAGALGLILWGLGFFRK